MTPLYSDKDLRLYLSNNIKYGVSTNEMGLFVVRNNNKEKLSKSDIDNIIGKMGKIDNSLIKKFEKDKKIKYNRNDDNHKYLLNEYLKDNFDEWEMKYNSFLSEYNMKATFINAKKHNNV